MRYGPSIRRDFSAALLEHQEPDRVPRFEIWIDGVLDELGQDDPAAAYVNLGQDCLMMPTRVPAESNAWRNGVDEWGRVWQDGTFVDGVVDTDADLERYNPPLDYVELLYIWRGSSRFDWKAVSTDTHSVVRPCARVVWPHASPMISGHLLRDTPREPNESATPRANRMCAGSLNVINAMHNAKVRLPGIAR